MTSVGSSSVRSVGAGSVSSMGSLDSAHSGVGGSGSRKPVFRFGDRILLEVRTRESESGFLGLDDDLSEANLMEHEMPPLALMTTPLLPGRVRNAAALALPPPLNDAATQGAGAKPELDDEYEFYVENCVFELTSSNSRNKGLELTYGKRVALAHVLTGKHLQTRTGADGKTHLVLADSGFSGLGLASQFEMQPCYADRVRGERIEHGDHLRIISAVNSDGIQVKRATPATDPAGTPARGAAPELEEYALRMSASASKMTGFMCRPFARYAPGLADLVKGGDVIRIEHIERSMFIRADYGKATDLTHKPGEEANDYGYVWEKGDAGRKDPPLCFDPRQLLNGTAERKTPSVQISPDEMAQQAELRDLFRVEVVSQVFSRNSPESKWIKQLAGSPLHWNSTIRLRHLCSNKYLEMVPGRAYDGLELSAVPTAHAVFALSSTTAESLDPTVRYGSKMRIRSADMEKATTWVGTQGKGDESTIGPAPSGKIPYSDVFTIEAVKTRVVQDLRFLMYMREALLRLVDKLAWKRQEADWVQDVTGSYQLIGKGVGGDDKKAEDGVAERWTFSTQLPTTDASKQETNLLLTYARESLTKLIQFVCGSSSLDPLADGFDIGDLDLRTDKQQQLQATKILDLACATALLPGEWALNCAAAYGKEPEIKSAADRRVAMELQTVSQLGHLLTRMIVTDNRSAACYVYESCLLHPLIRQLKNSRVGSVGRGVWSWDQSSLNAVATIKTVLQDDMVDNFDKKFIAANFARIPGGGKIQTTVDKYSFLCDVCSAIFNGIDVTRHQLWILEDVMHVYQQDFLPYPVLDTEFEAHDHTHKTDQGEEPDQLRAASNPDSRSRKDDEDGTLADGNLKFVNPLSELKDTSFDDASPRDEDQDDGVSDAGAVQAPSTRGEGTVQEREKKGTTGPIWVMVPVATQSGTCFLDDPDGFTVGPHLQSRWAAASGTNAVNAFRRVDLIKLAEEDTMVSKLFYRYAQLISLLCIGRNYYAQCKCAEVFTCQHVAKAISHRDLPDKWKATYINLFTNLFVAHRVHTRVLKPKQIQHYSQKFVQKQVNHSKAFSKTTDVNRDGQLDAAEIIAAGDAVAELDLNHDGVIDREELKAAGLEALDVNNDGRLDATELDVIDTNHDGKISRKELGALDANHDGIVSKKELLATIERKRQQRLSREKAEEMKVMKQRQKWARAAGEPLCQGEKLRESDKLARHFLELGMDFEDERNRIEQMIRHNSPLFWDFFDDDTNLKGGITPGEWIDLKRFLLDRVHGISVQTKKSLIDETSDDFEGASGHLTYACLNLTSDLLSLGLLCDDDSMKDYWNTAMSKITVTTPISRNDDNATLKRNAYKVRAIREYTATLDCIQTLRSNRNTTRVVNFFRVVVMRAYRLQHQASIAVTKQKRGATNVAGIQNTLQAGESMSMRQAMVSAMAEILKLDQQTASAELTDLVGRKLSSYIFRSSDPNDKIAVENQLKCSNSILALLISEDSTITRACLRMLNRNYNQRGELKTSVSNLTLVTSDEEAALEQVSFELRVYMKPIMDYAFHLIHTTDLNANEKKYGTETEHQTHTFRYGVYEAPDLFRVAAGIVMRWRTSMEYSTGRVVKVTQLEDVMEKHFKDSSNERKTMKEGLGTDDGEDGRVGWLGTPIHNYEKPFDGLDDRGQEIDKHTAGEGLQPDDADFPMLDVPIAITAVSESSVPQYVFEMLLATAKLFRNGSLRRKLKVSVPMSESVQFTSRKGNAVSMQQSEDKELQSLFESDMMKNFYHEVIRLLTVYAAQKHDFNEEMIELFLDNTKQADDPLTLLLLHMIDTCGGRISCAIARMYSVFFRRTENSTSARHSSSLDLTTNLVVARLLETCVVYEVGDKDGVVSVQKQYRPDHLQFFMQLLETLSSDLTASVRKQHDIYGLLFNKDMFIEEAILVSLVDKWFTHDQACLWKGETIFARNDRSKIDPEKAKRAIAEIDPDFLHQLDFDLKNRDLSKVSAHYSVAEHQELLAAFSKYWVDADDDVKYKKDALSKPHKYHPEWGVSGTKKLQLFFYDHFLQVAAMLTRGNSASVIELEQNLKRWIATTTEDRVTSREMAHEDLGKASEILLLNFLQDQPITNKQKDRVAEERARFEMPKKRDSPKEFKSRIVDISRDVIKFKGPVLQFLMATFLDSAEFRQKRQQLEDRARQEEKLDKKATGGLDDGDAGGTGELPATDLSVDDEAPHKETFDRAKRYADVLAFSLSVIVKVYGSAKAQQKKFPTWEDVGADGSQRLVPQPRSPRASMREARDNPWADALTPAAYRRRYRGMEVFSNYGDPSYVFYDLVPFLLTYCDVWLGETEEDDNDEEAEDDTDEKRRKLIGRFPSAVRALFEHPDSEFAQALRGLLTEFDFTGSAFAPRRAIASKHRQEIGQLIRRLAFGDPADLVAEASKDEAPDRVYKVLMAKATQVRLVQQKAEQNLEILGGGEDGQNQSVDVEMSASIKGSSQLNREWKIFRELLGTFGNPKLENSDGAVTFTEEGQHIIHPFKLILLEAMGYELAQESEPLIPAEVSGTGGDEADGSNSSSQDGKKRVRFGSIVARQILSRMMIYLARESHLSTESDVDFSTYLNQKRAILILTELLKRKTWRSHFADRNGNNVDKDALDLHRCNCQRSLGFYFAGVEMLVHHLSMARDIKVVQYPRTMELINATTDFGMRLLEGGNRETQDKVLDTVMSAQEGVHANSATAHFLNGACNLVRYLCQQLVSETGLQREGNGRFFRSMLKLLQELCDGNNERMQNFFLEQPDFEDSVNVVLVISDTLNVLFEDHSQGFKTLFMSHHMYDYTDNYNFNYRGEACADHKEENGSMIGCEHYRRRKLIKWIHYDHNAIKAQKELCRNMQQIFRTLTDFLEGPNRRVIGTLRASSEMGHISHHLLKYLGSRLFPSRLLAQVGYHGADKSVKPDHGIGTKKKENNGVQTFYRPDYRRDKAARHLHAPPVWMDDPCTQVALTIFEQTKLVTRIPKGGGRDDVWKKLPAVHELYVNWRAGIGRDPRKSFTMLLREFEKLELTILNTIQRQLEGRQRKDTWSYMANTYRSEDLLQNFQMHCIHSMLETRLRVPEPGTLQGMLQKGFSTAGAGVAEVFNAVGKLENMVNIGGNSDKYAENDELDDEDDTDDYDSNANYTDASIDPDDFKELCLTAVSDNEYRESSAYDYAMAIHEESKGFSSNADPACDYKRMRMKYFVLIEACASAKHSKGIEADARLKWMKSVDANKLLTLSFQITQGTGRRKRSRHRHRGSDLGMRHAETVREVIDEMGSVEIQRKVLDSDEDPELERIYFHIPPLFERFKELGREIKVEHAKSYCNEENLEDQLNAFNKASFDLIDEAVHKNQRISQVEFIPGAPWLLKNEARWGWMALMVSFVINGLLVKETTYDHARGRSVREESWQNTSINVLGYVHAVMSLILVAEYWLIRASFLTMKALSRKAEVDFVVEDDALIPYLRNRKLPAFVWQAYFNLTWPLIDFQSLYIVAYACSSCFGALTEHKFAFSVHLLDVCRREPVLRTVLSVVSNKASQLLVTLGLGSIVVYLYTVVGFLFLNGEYEIFNKGGTGTCTWLYECLLFHLDYGFREAPAYQAVGAPLVNDTYEFSHEESWAGVLFNAVPFVFGFSYNLLVILVLVAIITGIVIDSFGARREQDDDKSDQLANTCFICGKSRNEFEHLGLDFYRHQKHSHNLWTYLAFFMHLHLDDDENFGAGEAKAYEQWKLNINDFFPMRRAIVLEDQKKEEEGIDKLHRKVAELQRELTKQTRVTKESTQRLSTQLNKLSKDRSGTRLSEISEEHSDSGSSFGGSSIGWQ